MLVKLTTGRPRVKTPAVNFTNILQASIFYQTVMYIKCWSALYYRMQGEPIFWFRIFQHSQKWCQQAVVDDQRNVKASQRMKSENWNTLKRIIEHHRFGQP